MADQQKKLSYIVLIQFFAVVCVFIGHSTHIFCNWGWFFHKPVVINVLNNIHDVVYSFHMPLFMFLSGYLFCVTRKSDFKIVQYIYKRFKRLIVPFYIWGLCYCTPIYTFIKLNNQNYFEHMKEWLNFHFNGHLWFLGTLFILTLVIIPLNEYIFKKINSFIVFLVLTIISSIEITGINKLIVKAIKYSPMFYLGFVFYQYRANLEKFSLNNKNSLAISVLFIILQYLSLGKFSGIYSYITPIASIFIIYCLSIWLCNKFKNLTDNKLIQFITTNMMLIYILHEPIMVILLDKLGWGQKHNPYLVASTLFFGTWIIVLAIVKLWKTINYNTRKK